MAKATSILAPDVTEALASRDAARAAVTELTSDHRLNELRSRLSETLAAMRAADPGEAVQLAAQVAGLERLVQEHAAPVRDELRDAARQNLRRASAVAARAAEAQHKRQAEPHFARARAAVVEVLDALDDAGNARHNLAVAAGLGINDELEGLCRRAANELALHLGVPTRRLCPAELAAERGR